jgi:hypothetical protein
MHLVDEPLFDTMNETDVREIVVRPLLERLGYLCPSSVALCGGLRTAESTPMSKSPMRPQ